MRSVKKESERVRTREKEEEREELGWKRSKMAGQTAGKPIRCKAAVSRKAGEPLVMEEVTVAPPKANEVRMKIICTSLCHTDVTFWRLNEPPSFFPMIQGHEAVGTVESVGSNVKDIVPGDYVIPTFLADCGDCPDCKSSKSNLCSSQPFEIAPYMPRDKTTRFTDSKGETIYHFVNISSFSQYTVIDAAHVAKVDPAIPPNRACLIGCGISTGVGASWRAAGVEPGSTVAVFGLGVIGLAAVEGARLCGASRIIGVDLNPDKSEIGKQFGLTDFINPKDCGDKSVSQLILEMTGGGADYCIECVGLSSLVTEAFASSRKGWGKTVVLGVDKPDAKISLSSYDVLMSGKSVHGSLFGHLKPKSDVPTLVNRYLNKELQLDGFVTHEMKIEDINKAFDLLIEGKCLRCVMWME